ncbi:MAG: S-adenosylmethionine:tRNA ribosyltransferase-isomerase [Anaerolineae bacterium]|nr:S-adenosylmethionine:tRNA ribosyltransferase-isomerase [Anaerolineae bacterium]
MSVRTRLDNLDFQLPPELEATAPPEARGLTRDAVRLMVTRTTDDHITHTQFCRIGDHLQPGDVLVINTSGTLNAALSVQRADGAPFALHLSTHLPDGDWAIELRALHGGTTRPHTSAQPGERYLLPGGGSAILHSPYSDSEPGHVRLWRATISLPLPLLPYLDQYGAPIRYWYVPETWDNRYYQTVYATEMGSAEMPSAGRAFTPELLVRLMAQGVQIVPLILHTGVASLEDKELPYAEFYRVPEATARAINAAHTAGSSVIAVGTTVVRALESVTGADGITHGGEGWTDLIITPERGVRAVDGLLTGLHEPRATHLAMLEALASRDHLQLAYGEALAHGYLWHEFGDLHLIRR